MNSLVIISIGLLFKRITCNQGTLSYPFIINQKNTTFQSKLRLEFISKYNICIGTPYLCKNIQFLPNTYITAFLLDNEHYPAVVTSLFNPSLSSSFKYYFDSHYGFNDEFIYQGKHCTDRIYFGDLELKEMHFYLALMWSPIQLYSTIGLNVDLRPNPYPSFIKLLKNNSIIDSLEYSVEIVNDTEGMITIGKDLTLNKDNTILRLVMPKINHPLLHYFAIQRIYLGNESNTIALNGEAIFDEAFGFIQLTIEMKSIISQTYLTDLNCEEEIITYEQYRTKITIYSHFICEKARYDIKKDIPDFVFEFNEGRLSLNREELFNQYDSNRVRFIIVFLHTNVPPKLIIGYPMIKKFKIHHDFEAFTLSFHTKSDLNQNRVSSSNESSISMISLIIKITTVLMIFGLINNGLLCFKNINNIIF